MENIIGAIAGATLGYKAGMPSLKFLKRHHIVLLIIVLLIAAYNILQIAASIFVIIKDLENTGFSYFTVSVLNIFDLILIIILYKKIKSKILKNFNLIDWVLLSLFVLSSIFEYNEMYNVFSQDKYIAILVAYTTIYSGISGLIASIFFNTKNLVVAPNE